MRRGHRQALDAYALHLRRRNLAAGTQANLIAGATRFLATAAHGLRRLQRSDVRAFLATRSLALQPSTLVAEASRVRCFLAWAAAEGLAPEGLAEAISVPNPPKRQRRVLSEAAVARLLRAASWSTCPTALRDRACLEILYGLGLRASEVAAVRVLDLDLAEGTLQVRPAKRGPPRVLPLPRAALPHLATYLREARPWLVRLERDRGHLLVSRMGLPLTNRNVCRLVTRLGRAADASWVRPHDLRRALATHLVRRGVSVLAVVDLLGHSDVGACEPYLVSLAPLPRVTDHPLP